MKKIQLSVYMFLAIATAAFAYQGTHSGAEIDDAIDTVQTMSTYMKTVIDDTDAATARATLGLILNSDVQAYSAKLLDLASLSNWSNNSGDLQAADGAQIDDASGDPVAQINDGQEWEWPSGSSQAGIDAVNLSAEGKFQVAGTALSSTTRTLTNHTYDGSANTHRHEDGTSPTVDTPGQIKIDTTKDQLLYYGTALRTIVYDDRQCLTIQSPNGTTHDDVPIFSLPYGFTVTDMRCYASGGTSVQITLNDGSNNLDTMTCDTDGADDDGSIANATFNADEQMWLDTGTVTGTVNFVNFCFSYTITRE